MCPPQSYLFVLLLIVLLLLLFLPFFFLLLLLFLLRRHLLLLLLQALGVQGSPRGVNPGGDPKTQPGPPPTATGDGG